MRVNHSLAAIKRSCRLAVKGKLVKQVAIEHNFELGLGLDTFRLEQLVFTLAKLRVRWPTDNCTLDYTP